jgi:hypothetical protein
MKYYAVHLKTESGDDHTFLLKGEPVEALAEIAKIMGDELAFICDWDIASEPYTAAEDLCEMLQAVIQEAQDELDGPLEEDDEEE